MTEMELLLHFPIGCKVVRKDNDMRSADMLYGAMAPDVVLGYEYGMLVCTRNKQAVRLNPRNYKVVE
jgi:hypothetical protein